MSDEQDARETAEASNETALAFFRDRFALDDGSLAVALWLGVVSEDAAAFSFILSVPAIAGAGLLIIAYSTVMTIMRTLEAKGHVRHTQEGKAFRFYPLTEPDDAADTALGRIVNKVFHGSRELVINRLVSDEDVSAEELRRIKENLERRLEELER